MNSKRQLSKLAFDATSRPATIALAMTVVFALTALFAQPRRPKPTE